MSQSSDDLRLLLDSALSWVNETAALDTRRDDGAATTVKRWQAMSEMGWPAVTISEAYDGAGLGFAGLGGLLETLGRELLPSPLLSSALVSTALQWGGTEAQRSAWLPRLAGGTAAAFAIDESAHHRPARIDTQATPIDGGWQLRGAKRYVSDAGTAELLLVAANTPRGIGLFLAEAAHIDRQPVQRIDAHDCAHLEFDTWLGPDALLGELADSSDLLDRLLDLGRIGLAAEMLGAAERTLEITCSYLCTRKQFDRPIGSFQALQHRAALMRIDVELTRSSVEAALEALDRDQTSEVPELACVAKAMANVTIHRSSNEIVQMHGGIGMTAEHVAGCYLKRARVTESLYGNNIFQADRFANLNGY